MTQHIFKAAAIQASPIYFDLAATLNKAVSLVREAASTGAKLIVFPETFLPGYPFFIWLEAYPFMVDKIAAYISSCPTYDGPEFHELEALAKELQVTIVMGAAEKEGGSLFMSQWILGPTCAIAQRRKLKPTLVERMIFGEGDGSDLKVFDTSLGKIGALNCWEHVQPLIKHAMATQHEQIHCASWPHFAGMMPFFSLTMDVNYNASRMYAVETGSFVIASTAPMSISNSRYLCGDDEGKKLGLGLGGGASMIFDPEGREIADKLDHDAEGILYAEVDTDKCARAKSALDTVGHYGKGDVFRVEVDMRSKGLARLGRNVGKDSASDSG